MRILVVCTGNICRSPLVEQVLRARLAEMPTSVASRIVIESAGTAAEAGAVMPEPAARWSAQLGGDPSGHASRYLNEPMLQGADLVLTMEREQRGRVVALAPALLRRTFTLREFARFAGLVTEAEVQAALDGPFVGPSPEARLAAVLGLLADARGFSPQLEDPTQDDVVDPYRRSEKTYALAAEQMRPGIEAVARVIAMPVLWQD